MKKSFKLFSLLLMIGGSTWSLGQGARTPSLAGDGDGICCQRDSGSCSHPNGMDFENATWISGSSTCTGHEG